MPVATRTLAVTVRRTAVPSLAAVLISAGAMAEDRSPRWDTEIDPVPYALHGYSVHLGGITGHLRVEVGAYATDIPSWLDGNRRFNVSVSGVGVKLQYFPAAETRGWFAGLSAGPEREHIKHIADGARDSLTVSGFGPELGYRIPWGERFYATPWVGLVYSRSAGDLAVGDGVYRDRRLMPFAAVHLGVRF